MIYLRDAALPLVDLFLMLPGGAYYEGKTMRGATKLIAAALTAGCRKYSEKEFNEILDSHAIDFTVSAGTASIRIAVQLPEGSAPAGRGNFSAISCPRRCSRKRRSSGNAPRFLRSSKSN